MMETGVDRQEAIEFLLDHYESPRNYGALAAADVVVCGGHPDCADVVTIYLKVDAASQTIEKLSFEGAGCSVSQAAASVLTEMVPGMSLAQVETIDFHAMIDSLGRDVVSSRPRCATLALGTLKTAIARYRAGETSRNEQYDRNTSQSTQR